ncbi:hypothetical protein BH10CYA1_BH10CYA1_52930 [soil metagenome]
MRAITFGAASAMESIFISSNLFVVMDERFQEHIPPVDHPDSPQRFAAILKAFHSSELSNSVRQISSRLATDEELMRVHNSSYLRELSEAEQLAASTGHSIQLDSDTWMSARTYEVSRLAAGAGCLAVENIKAGTARNAFVNARPAGHHALRDRAMGFCLLNNIAIAARHAQEELGFKRILIVDWDVHHGNGTQASFYYDPNVCFISLHRQWPFYPPDSGLSTEDGGGDGKGFNVNIPLPPGTGDRGYLKAWDSLVAPIAIEFAPELILLSAGYDAHLQDPLGGQRISSAGYFLLSRRIAELAEATRAPLVAFLEEAIT